MFNILFEDEYAAACHLITRMRMEAGLGQRQLAAQLARSQSHVQRMETRQRPIELVEFCRIARACGVHPRDALAELLREWARAGRAYAPPGTGARDEVAA